MLGPVPYLPHLLVLLIQHSCLHLSANRNNCSLAKQGKAPDWQMAEHQPCKHPSVILTMASQPPHIATQSIVNVQAGSDVQRIQKIGFRAYDSNPHNPVFDTTVKRLHRPKPNGICPPEAHQFPILRIYPVSSIEIPAPIKLTNTSDD